MRNNGRSFIVAILVSTGALALTGCGSTGDEEFNMNKAVFWEPELTDEEKAEAERQKEIGEQYRLKEELERKIAAEEKAKKDAKAREEMESELRLEQAKLKVEQDKADLEAKKNANSVEVLKEQMRLQIVAEMKAEEEAKVAAKLKAEAEAKAAEEELARKKAERDAREFTNLSIEEKDAVRKLAEGYAKSFLESLDDEEYVDFIKDMSPSLIKSITKKKFEAFSSQVQKAKGEFVRFHYLGELKSGVFVTLVYKVEYKRESSKSNTNDESMLRLALAKLDGKYMIWSFSLD